MAWTILTGGQTGVDTGALLAARELGLPWKAIFPAGFRREKPIPEWMKEHAQALQTSDRYDDRTRYCVQQATEVLCFGGHLNTPGTTLTCNLCAHYGRPLFNTSTWFARRRWMDSGVLMVAGPRASKWADGSGIAYKTLKMLFKEWKPEVDLGD